MGINIVVQDGVVKSPALRYGADGKPEFRFTLKQSEKGWSLFLPCVALGSVGERLAGELEDGENVVITSGKLCYRKRSIKGIEQSRLEILVWSVDRLATLPQDQSLGQGEGNSEGDESPMAPEAKVRRARYQKYRGAPNPN
jgi:hypothetical protein